MAAFALRADSVRFNPLPLPENIPPRRAEIEALVERLIAALDVLDDLDGFEDDDEDCCGALDDTGSTITGSAYAGLGQHGPGDPDDAEDDDPREDDDPGERDETNLSVVLSPGDFDPRDVTPFGAPRHAG